MVCSGGEPACAFETRAAWNAIALIVRALPSGQLRPKRTTCAIPLRHSAVLRRAAAWHLRCRRRGQGRCGLGVSQRESPRPRSSMGMLGSPDQQRLRAAVLNGWRRSLRGVGAVERPPEEAAPVDLRNQERRVFTGACPDHIRIHSLAQCVTPSDRGSITTWGKSCEYHG